MIVMTQRQVLAACSPARSRCSTLPWSKDTSPSRWHPAQPRPRAFARNGKARVFDPGTAEGWKAMVALAAKPFLAAPFTQPIRVVIEFLFPRPKGHSLPATSKRPAPVLRADAPVYHVAKPDADNAAKAVLDALTTVGLWTDDAIVAELVVTKRYADQRGEGAAITIKPLTRAHEIPGAMVIEPGREHHASWFRLFRHPDADLIDAAPPETNNLKD